MKVLQNIKRQIIKLLFILFFLTLNYLYANTNANNINRCAIPSEIMATILMTEGDRKRKIGYEYFIRVNGKKNANKAKRLLKAHVDNNYISQMSFYVYDCKSEAACISATKKLIENKIVNLDLGAYQTNFYYHASRIENYFTLETSYLLACKYLHTLVNQYGWSWKTIARYHSSTKKHNEKYQKILFANYKKILKIKRIKKNK